MIDMAQQMEASKSSHFLTKILGKIWAERETSKKHLFVDGELDIESFNDFLYKKQKELDFEVYEYLVDFIKQKYVLERDFFKDLNEMANAGLVKVTKKNRISITERGVQYAGALKILNADLGDFIQKL